MMCHPERSCSRSCEQRSRRTCGCRCPFVCHPVGICFCLCRCFFAFIQPQKQRHLDRSNGQSHRPLRSGEIPAFRSCRCYCFVLCLSSRRDLLLPLLVLSQHTPNVSS